MTTKTGVFIQGSFFCEKCNREYDEEGTCECGGDIKFISMHSNRYLGVWMKSKKVVGNEDTKKVEDKGDINISLYDNVKKLRELLGQFPEMENSNDFDNELEKRMKLYKEIRGEIEALGKGIEIWAKTEDAWGRVKDNGIIV